MLNPSQDLNLNPSRDLADLETIYPSQTLTLLTCVFSL